jgi:competence ComEA-like helix-hairpin-helix protein
MAISKRNKRGVWALILLCVALAYVPRVIAGWSHQPIEVSHEVLNAAEAQVEVQQEQASKKKKAKYKKKKKQYNGPAQKFDPNEYSKENWMQLGLSEKQADVVLKFTQRGIRSNEELKKIFVIPDEVFDLIEDSTFYPKKTNTFEGSESREAKTVTIVNLNIASLEELKSLPGIGDFYAEKIIEHRDKLGGFVEKYQLLELWKFGNERYDKIKERISVLGTVDKININEADFEALNKHPYISYKVANSIVKMRNVHGAYTQVDQILRSVLIDEELFAKIQPYLSI